MGGVAAAAALTPLMWAWVGLGPCAGAQQAVGPPYAVFVGGSGSEVRAASAGSDNAPPRLIAQIAQTCVRIVDWVGIYWSHTCTAGRNGSAPRAARLLNSAAALHAMEHNVDGAPYFADVVGREDRLYGPYVLRAGRGDGSPSKQPRASANVAARAAMRCVLRQHLLGGWRNETEAWTACLGGGEDRGSVADGIRPPQVFSPAASPLAGATIALGILTVKDAAPCDSVDGASLCLAAGMRTAVLTVGLAVVGPHALPLGHHGPRGECAVSVHLADKFVGRFTEPPGIFRLVQDRLGSHHLTAAASPGCSARGPAPLPHSLVYDLLPHVTPSARHYDGTGSVARSDAAHWSMPAHVADAGLRRPFTAAVGRAVARARVEYGASVGALAPRRADRGGGGRAVFVGTFTEDGIRSMWWSLAQQLNGAAAARARAWKRRRGLPRVVGLVHYAMTPELEWPSLLAPRVGPTAGNASTAFGTSANRVVDEFRRAGAAVAVSSARWVAGEEGQSRDLSADVLPWITHRCELQAFTAAVDARLCREHGAADPTGAGGGGAAVPLSQPCAEGDEGVGGVGQGPWTRACGCAPGLAPVPQTVGGSLAALAGVAAGADEAERAAVDGRCGPRRVPRWVLVLLYRLALPLRWLAPDVVFLPKARDASDPLMRGVAALAGARLLVGELHATAFASGEGPDLVLSSSRWLLSGQPGAHLPALADGRAVVVPPRAGTVPSSLSAGERGVVRRVFRAVCPACAPLTVVIVSRVSKDKGVLLPVRAAARAPPGTVRLHYLGTGPMAGPVAAVAARKGVWAAMHGHVAHTPLRRLLFDLAAAGRGGAAPLSPDEAPVGDGGGIAQCRRMRDAVQLLLVARRARQCLPLVLAVLASTGETWGIAAAEAMHAGLPLLTLAAGGTMEFVEGGRTALVADPPRVGTLARYLVELADADSADGMRARERARGIGRAAEREAGLRLGGWVTASAYRRIVQAAMAA